MATTNINEKIHELANNKEFMDKIHKTASIEEYQQLLAAHGVDTTVEELKSGLEQMAPLFGENGELTVEALDVVAGGRGVNVVTGLGLGGQIACTLVMMAGAATPVGWFAAACACGGVALLSMC